MYKSSRGDIKHNKKHAFICRQSSFSLTEFNISDEVASDIRQTREWFDNSRSTLRFQYFVFDKFGGNFIKSLKMSPDSFIQLGFQVSNANKDRV